ncbi:unnamed protein product, partial [Urochloa humidicola]
FLRRRRQEGTSRGPLDSSPSAAACLCPLSRSRRIGGSGGAEQSRSIQSIHHSNFKQAREAAAAGPQAMDGAANWRPTQGADPTTVAAAGGVDPNAAAPAGGDWRTQLQPEARSRIVNKIMETLKKHLPVSVPEGLSELQKIAVRFEEKIYTAATNQSDYLRKISLKMLSMESQTKTQQNPGNAQVIPNPNPPGPGSSSKGKNGKKLRCRFCKKGGHFKKDCPKKKKWFEMKGIAYDPTHKRT